MIRKPLGEYIVDSKVTFDYFNSLSRRNIFSVFLHSFFIVSFQDVRHSIEKFFLSLLGTFCLETLVNDPNFIISITLNQKSLHLFPLAKALMDHFLVLPSLFADVIPAAQRHIVEPEVLVLLDRMVHLSVKLALITRLLQSFLSIMLSYGPHFSLFYV